MARGWPRKHRNTTGLRNQQAPELPNGEHLGNDIACAEFP